MHYIRIKWRINSTFWISVWIIHLYYIRNSDLHDNWNWILEFLVILLCYIFLYVSKALFLLIHFKPVCTVVVYYVTFYDEIYVMWCSVSVLCVCSVMDKMRKIPTAKLVWQKILIDWSFKNSTKGAKQKRITQSFVWALCKTTSHEWRLAHSTDCPKAEHYSYSSANILKAKSSCCFGDTFCQCLLAYTHATGY